MELKELTAAMEKIAPPGGAESWDNVGLLAGDLAQNISSVLLTIDYTRDVAEEGKRIGCDAVIAYHPPIFHALKRITAGSLIYDAIRRGVAIYSPHTALDAARGGTNDVLCDLLDLVDRRPLKISETKATGFKLVTFVPLAAVEKVSQAMFDAGAGRIGDYRSCSFRSQGTGTFFGEAGTNPAVGASGKLEHADEIRIETIAPIDRVSQIIGALRAAHPYEEPAFDLLQLAAAPESTGIGRVGNLPNPAERSAVFDRLKKALNLDALLIAGPTTGEVTRIAVCAGACGDLLDQAIAQKAGLYVTGEMRHHDALKAAAVGLTVVCTLHSNSERVTLKRLKERLGQLLPNLPFHLSTADRDPFSVR